MPLASLFERKQSQEPRPCPACVHFLTGHVDRQVSWMRCEKGMCLLSQGDMLYTHLDENSASPAVIKVTRDGWTAPLIPGEPRLTLGGCKHWARRPQPPHESDTDQ